MIKPVTFQAAGNFKANLYAAEIKSRFIDQAAAHGYYKGYGAELSATVSGTRIIIGTGAAVICGRMFEVTADETVNVDISGGVVGYVIAHLETYHPADEKNVTFIARTAATLSEIPLIQNDIYAVDADNVNKVYEYPLYSFSISDGAIANVKREIKGIAEATAVAQKADTATATATAAATTATAADAKADTAVTTANGAAAVAADANTKSDNAVTTATQAAATATAADVNADAAITTANGAEETATDADAKADNAVVTATQAAATAGQADAKADAAVTTADEAKQIATDAKEGSGTKVTSGGIFVSSFNADSKINIEDLVNVLTSDETNKALTAAQGKALKELIDGLIKTDNNFTTEEKTKLASVEEGAQINTVIGVKGENEKSYRNGNVSITKANLNLSKVANEKQMSNSNPPLLFATTLSLNSSSYNFPYICQLKSMGTKPYKVYVSGGNSMTGGDSTSWQDIPYGGSKNLVYGNGTMKIEIDYNGKLNISGGGPSTYYDMDVKVGIAADW